MQAICKQQLPGDWGRRNEKIAHTVDLQAMSENNRLSVRDISFLSETPLRRGSFSLGRLEFFLPRSRQN